MTTMAKRIKLIYALLLAMALPLLTACSSDDTGNDGGLNNKGEKITVRFRVSQAGTNTMRAANEWEDKVAEDKEMMNIWTVIAVNVANDNVAGIWSCKPTGKGQEVDEIEEIFKAELDKTSSYRFYSFANMGADYLEKKLKLTTGIIPVPTDADKIEAKTDNLGNITLTEETVNAAVVSINGNGFDPTAADNTFGATGIPMSNVQTFNDLQDGSLKDLIVVRMLAKVELWLYNGKGETSDGTNNIKIKSIVLTDITKNASDNLYLLPKYASSAPPNSPNVMDSGKLEPNVHKNSDNKTETTSLTILKLSPEDDRPVVKEVVETSNNQWTIEDKRNKYVDGSGTNDSPVKITFYVNESATPKNGFGHFFLELDVEGDIFDKNANKKVRYTMIDDKNKGDGSGNWNYIARNDYRIIPIVLDDYKLDMIPYDFPAIGVLPASVKEEDGIYTINFHDYGHFHLQPKVTRYSDKSLVPYGASEEGAADKTFWTLADDETSFTTDNCKSWTSWVDAKKEASYSGTFYRNETTPTLIDGDEVGGEPVWYLNNESPRWASDWAPSTSGDGGTALGFQPFIFGYIADPEASLDNDLKVYHEFTIDLYKNGSGPARQMTYRLYMILDTDQMLYRGDGNGSTNGAPRVRHPHCLH